MLEMPVLETLRLFIRPFMMEDLPAAYQLFDVELAEADLHAKKMGDMSERAEWLQWCVLNGKQLARLNQPPYGDRAIVLKATGLLIGSCGYVPCLNAFEQLAYFSPGGIVEGPVQNTPEFGLFYAISPTHRRRGYASEAVQALVDYAFDHLKLKRIVATTDYDNIASIGVMMNLDMYVEKNSLPEPPWLQVVGVLENKLLP